MTLRLNEEDSFTSVFMHRLYVISASPFYLLFLFADRQNLLSLSIFTSLIRWCVCLNQSVPSSCSLNRQICGAALLLILVVKGVSTEISISLSSPTPPPASTLWDFCPCTLSSSGTLWCCFHLTSPAKMFDLTSSWYINKWYHSLPNHLNVLKIEIQTFMPCWREWIPVHGIQSKTSLDYARI